MARRRRMMSAVEVTMAQERTLAGPSEPPLRTSVRLVLLVGLVYVVAGATHPGTSGRHLTATVLTVTTAVGWGLWLLDQLTKRWGIDGSAGTTAWFEMGFDNARLDGGAQNLNGKV